MRGAALALFIVAVGAWFLAACAAIAPFVERPRAEVRGVSIASLRPTGVDGEVLLEVFNPNSFSVPLHRIDWQLAIGDASAIDGSFDLSESIPARASAPVAISLHLDGGDAIAVARRLVAGERTYRLSGVMHFMSAVGEIPVPFSESGNITTAIERLALRSSYAPHHVQPDRDEYRHGALGVSPPARLHTWVRRRAMASRARLQD